MTVVLFFSYLFWVNVAAFLAYAMDKRFAYYNRWRISEATLLGLAVTGGACGAGLAMLLFRHKTLHRQFTITVPVSFVVWLAIALTLYLSFTH